LLKGYEPDVNSIRFKADNLDDFNDLYRHYKIKPSRNDQSVQLRFEGMDAVELNYKGHGQPAGDYARDRLLEILGFTDVRYNHNGVMVESCYHESIESTILTQAADPLGSQFHTF